MSHSTIKDATDLAKRYTISSLEENSGISDLQRLQAGMATPHSVCVLSSVPPYFP